MNAQIYRTTNVSIYNDSCSFVASGMGLKKFEAAYYLLDCVYPTENTMCFHETDQWTLYMQLRDVYCMNQMEHINKLDEQSAGFLMLKPDGTGNNHWALYG